MIDVANIVRVGDGRSINVDLESDHCNEDLGLAGGDDHRDEDLEDEDDWEAMVGDPRPSGSGLPSNR